jgi:hypothetical protein
MEIFLFLIIVLQLAYSIFKDLVNSKERERLELKLMSKSTIEYKDAVDDSVEEERKPEEQKFIPLEEVSYEKIMKAKDLS